MRCGGRKIGVERLKRPQQSKIPPRLPLETPSLYDPQPMSFDDAERISAKLGRCGGGTTSAATPALPDATRMK